MIARARLMVVLFVLVRGAVLYSAAPATMTGADRYGGPLPYGAIMRLGTLRLRHDVSSRNAHMQLIFSPDGKSLLSFGETDVRLWDLSSGRRLTCFLSGDSPHAARLLPDGKTLVIARREHIEHAGKPALWWHVERWEWGNKAAHSRVDFPATTEPRDRQVHGLLSPHGKLLASLKFGSNVVLYDTVAGRQLHQIDVPVSVILDATFTPDSRQLILLSGNGDAYIYDTSTGKRVRELVFEESPERFPDTIYVFPQVSPDGRLLAYTGARELFLWDLRLGKLLARRRGVMGPAVFSPDGKALVCVAKRRIHLLEARTLNIVRVFESDHAISWIPAIRFSPDGKRLALCGPGAIILWDVTTGEPLPRQAGHFSSVSSLAFSQDGRWLASGGDDGLAIVWDLATGRAIHTFSGHAFCVASVAFSPDGRTLATGESSYYLQSPLLAQVRLFDLTSGRLLRQFHGHLHGINALCFSPDGKRLATGGVDERIRLWETATGKRLGQIRHLNDIRPDGFMGTGNAPLLRFLDQGNSLLVRQGHEVEYLIDTRSLNLEKRKQQRKEFFPEINRDQLRTLSPKGTLLAYSEYPGYGGLKHKIALWDLITRKQFAVLSDHDNYMTPFVFSPDGRWFASATGESTILIWDVGRLWVKHMLSEFLAGRDDRLFTHFPELGIATVQTRLTHLAHMERRARRLIKDLDDDAFAVREKATEDLQKLGAEAAYVLRLSLKAGPTLEVRRRVERLVNLLNTKKLEPTFDDAKIRLAVVLLAKEGSEPARQALKDLAALEGETVVGSAARQALEKMRSGNPK